MEYRKWIIESVGQGYYEAFKDDTIQMLWAKGIEKLKIEIDEYEDE